ncbi:MAG: Hsp20/alpha crystallin family protein [Anaerolineae bacterium]|nr:Hsp20/alpha crystallin family protein [Anaerolineae bacterium]
MTSLIRWDPFREAMSLRNAIDRLFEESFVSPRFGWLAPLGAADVAIDMYETKDQVVVKAALPGIKPEQTEVTITGNTLTIRGEAKEEKEIKEENYICRERRMGAFSRSIALPDGLKTDKAEATFENGVLTLTIPKAEEKKAKTIKIKTK